MTDIIILLTIFILAVFVGVELITKIPPMLHTPLMSGTNAVSGITIIGALLSIPHLEPTVANIVATIALALATINVVGGFMVTGRILNMFQKKK